MEWVARAWAGFCLLMMRSRYKGVEVWRMRYDAAEQWLKDLRERRKPP